jgi:hypothetical protein
VLDTDNGSLLAVRAENGSVIVMDKNSVIASRLTDGNWTNGVSNTDHRILLFENPLYNLKKLTNASSMTVGKETFYIKSMDHDDNWIHIMLDRNVEIATYPNNLIVK